jgi:hypothetical protein
VRTDVVDILEDVVALDDVKMLDAATCAMSFRKGVHFLRRSEA